MKMYPIRNCEICPASGSWLIKDKDAEEFYCNQLKCILVLQRPFTVHPDCPLEDWPESKRG